MATYFNTWMKKHAEWDETKGILAFRLNEPVILSEKDGIKTEFQLGYGCMGLAPNNIQQAWAKYDELIANYPEANGKLHLVRCACIFSDYESHIILSRIEEPEDHSDTPLCEICEEPTCLGTC